MLIAHGIYLCKYILCDESFVGRWIAMGTCLYNYAMEFEIINTPMGTALSQLLRQDASTYSHRQEKATY
jgi:hypothetical protein